MLIDDRFVPGRVPTFASRNQRTVIEALIFDTAILILNAESVVFARYPLIGLKFSY